MAKKTKKSAKAKTTKKNTGDTARSNASKKSVKSIEFFGWQNLESWLDRATLAPSRKKFKACCYVLGSGSDWKLWKSKLKDRLSQWQLSQFGESKEIWRFGTDAGHVWVIKPRSFNSDKDKAAWQSSRYTQARDLAGRWFHDLENLGEESVQLVIDSDADREVEGFLVGLDLSAYSYRKVTHGGNPPAQLFIEGVSEQHWTTARTIARSVNIARHLVNTPPNELNPVSYADRVSALFKPFKSIAIDCWDEHRIQKAGMNLIQAVGQASDYPPRLLHLRYRPPISKKKKTQRSPIALVGKGITFDSGGLDIKPPAGMRLMKKDMGGSACLVGLLYWLAAERIEQPVDIYLPMAENAIAGNAFRPGDIYKSYGGRSVEIHNTDAEGRLILADALSLASEAKGEDRPEQVLCVATLTGAAKIALGAEISAYFSNRSDYHKPLYEAGREYGEWLWELPLFPPYKSLLKSMTADVSHCAATPFAGSITAALFLSEFVASDLPFAHFDIYGWNDKPKGALREPGGSGQIVQALIGYIRGLSS